ncbi:hypothetical protein BOTBODRAFT_110384 [Botryobasidium botryosum FD-172 SS1]|uniref:Carrier domain-containing protein n=1 Tax=Botryobasidium botryosum (strain FD-172 SS1) TaxID=930990 RepID=A0A067MH84_BOTB1|nr:hypothetical protein BOTBODRAFT_110384 [Botryobasidium botryosum FD-172 SS1]
MKPSLALPTTPAVRGAGDPATHTAKAKKTDDTHFHATDLVSLFRLQVSAHPTLLAVKDDHLALTYDELGTWSNIFCERIVDELGPCRAESVVAVSLPRSTLLVVSMQALAKAGLVCVILDPQHSPHYLKQLIQESKALLTIGASDIAKIFTKGALGDHRVLSIDDLVACVRKKTQSPMHLNSTRFEMPRVSPDSLLTVLFTSGTTGKPKGVMIEHRAMVNALNGGSYPVQTGDRTAITANTAFDAWTFDIWNVLGHGATAVMYTSHLADLDAFVDFVESEEISRAFLPTAVFARLVENPSLVRSLDQRLRTLVVAGEELKPHAVQAFLRSSSHIELINAYGPTEAAVVTTYYKVDPVVDAEGISAIPIGRPIANVSVHILDEEMRPVSPGKVGEICISGLSLARGYLNQKELTCQRFPLVSDLEVKGTLTRVYRTGDLGLLAPAANGSFLLHYQGRNDDQIKLRGQRIEPSQIERMLLEQKIPGISSGGQAVVVPMENGQLFAFIVKKEVSEPDDEAERIRASWEAFCNDVDNPGHIDPSLIGADFAKWISMYDGIPIPRDQMLEWLDDTIRGIHVTPNDSVLEIGCGTGMILFSVARRCRDYTGIDFSIPSIEFIRSKLASQGLVEKVTLINGAADQLAERLPEKQRFSLVIINSVTQYFGSRSYLEHVLNLCLDRVDDGGRIFLGDIRSYALLPHHDFTRTLHLDPSHDLPTTYISEEIIRLSRDQSELLTNPSFFTRMAQNSNGRITHVEIIPKEMEAVNELSQFRYQVVLHVGQLPFIPFKPQEWLDYESPKALEDLVASRKMVAVCGIPNKMVAIPHEALRLLSAGKAPSTSKALISAATASNWCTRALSPPDLRRLARRHARSVDLSWGAQSSDCTLSAVFTEERAFFKADFGGLIDGKTEPTNVPKARQSRSASSGELSAKLREACRARLPSYMVPNQILFLDELPLTANGKVDRKALADPLVWGPRLVSNGASNSESVDRAQTNTEIRITEILSEVLGLEPNAISRHADLFSLGLHSFSAAQIITKLSILFGTKLPIKIVYEHPTVTALASLIDQHSKGATNGVTEVPSYTEDLDRLYPALPTTFPQQSPAKSKLTFFLTGATGYTGLFILRDLMLRRDHDVAKVVCLVRGASADACSRRLFNNAAVYGINTTTWYSQASPPGSTLEVLQGDLGDVRFGLDSATWKRMTEEVDVVLANGALVSGVLHSAAR